MAAITDEERKKKLSSLLAAIQKIPNFQDDKLLHHLSVFISDINSQSLQIQECKIIVNPDTKKLIAQEIETFKKYEKSVIAGFILLTAGIIVCSVICPAINSAFGAALLSIGGYLSISLGLLAIAISALKLYFNNTEYKTINYLVEAGLFTNTQSDANTLETESPTDSISVHPAT